MNKPLPTKEIAVKRGGSVIHIYVASEDAREFVETECKVFGTLYPPNDRDNFYHLSVSPVYEANDVEAFILTYNTQNKEVE